MGELLLSNRPNRWPRVLRRQSCAGQRPATSRPATAKEPGGCLPARSGRICVQLRPAKAGAWRSFRLLDRPSRVGAIRKIREWPVASTKFIESHESPEGVPRASKGYGIEDWDRDPVTAVAAHAIRRQNALPSADLVARTLYGFGDDLGLQSRRTGRLAWPSAARTASSRPSGGPLSSSTGMSPQAFSGSS